MRVLGGFVSLGLGHRDLDLLDRVRHRRVDHRQLKNMEPEMRHEPRTSAVEYALIDLHARLSHLTRYKYKLITS